MNSFLSTDLSSRRQAFEDHLNHGVAFQRTVVTAASVVPAAGDRERGAPRKLQVEVLRASVHLVGAGGAGGAAMDSYPALPADGTFTTQFTGWKRVPAAVDINQKGYGNCWAEGPKASCAYKYPGWIMYLLQQEKDVNGQPIPGKWFVRYFAGNVETHIHLNTWVDEAINEPDWNGGDDWAAMMGKADAFFVAGLDTFAAMNGGWPTNMYNPMGITTQNITAPATAAAVATAVKGWVASGYLIQFATGSSPLGGMVASHDYAILGVNADGTILAYQPWGHNGGGFQNLQPAWLIASYGTFVVGQITAAAVPPVPVIVPPPAPGATGASAAFVGSDPVTLGNWIGKYGADGYVIVNYTPIAQFPSYGMLTVSGNSTWQWTNPPAGSDPRALQPVGGGSTRQVSCWYSTTSSNSFLLDCNLTDANVHQISLYFVDWEPYTRAVKVEIIDPSSGAILNTQSVTSFKSGIWLSWNITGHVQIRLTSQGSPNAVVSAICFDPAGTPSPAPTPTPTPAPSPTPTPAPGSLVITFNGNQVQSVAVPAGGVLKLAMSVS